MRSLERIVSAYLAFFVSDVNYISDKNALIKDKAEPAAIASVLYL